MDERLFPEVPEDLNALSDDELTTMRAEIQETLTALATGERERPDGMTQEEVFQVAAVASSDAARIKTHLDEAVAAEEEGRQRLLELAAEAGAELEVVADADDTTDTAADADTDEETDTSDADGDTTETPDTTEVDVDVEAESAPEVEAEVLPIAASAAPRRRYALPQRSGRHVPVVVNENPPAKTLVASNGLPGGIEGGRELDRIGLAEALITTYGKGRAAPGASDVVVASAHWEFPEDRILRESDYGGNAEKIMASNPILGMMPKDALVAAGGLCAPLTPFYDLPQFATTDRPVRDALPSYQATRGGVTVPTPGIIGDITSAITVITEAEDSAGGSAATKSCQDVDCPDFTDVAVTAIAHCRTYGNLGARAWPEQVAFENGLTMAAWARTAETYLLDRIKSLSIRPSATTQTYNAIFEWIYAVARTKASIRYLLRGPEDMRFRALAPVWLRDLMLADAAAAEDRVDILGQIDRFLGQQNVTISWYLDQIDSTAVFAAESTGSAIDGFPTVAEIALFPEGAFLHLDAGSLELGIVRDSVLNSTNDFQVFGESWEEVARIAPAQAARWLSLTICPKGTFPDYATALSC